MNRDFIDRRTALMQGKNKNEFWHCSFSNAKERPAEVP